MSDINRQVEITLTRPQLNKSYTRRTSELQKAKNKIVELEAELEDAWKEAEDIAREMDDFEPGIEMEMHVDDEFNAEKRKS